MSEQKKKFFFLNHKKSSALVVSVIIHIVFIVVALTFVAVQVYVKPEQIFEATAVKRPKMKLKKLQVPVKEKKAQAPKLRHTIVTKPKYKDVNIQMPEIIGVPGGTGYGQGDGLGGLGFGFDLDLFGSSRGTGNEFIGTFYDLKQDQDGELTKIGELAEENSYSPDTQVLACKVIKGFVGSGFSERRLKDFFKAPKLKYSTSFIMPPMAAEAAPEAFGVDDKVQGKYWICHYKGQIAAPETGSYRFCGIGDDILIVRVGKRVVLDASWPELIGKVSSWKSDNNDSYKFPINQKNYGSVKGADFMDIFSQIEDLGGYDSDVSWGYTLGQVKIDGENFDPKGSYMSLASRLVIGDWVRLRKGQPVDVDILIGEFPGGFFASRLLIEKQGVSYKMVESDAGPRPVLPIFKTTPVDEKLVSKMELDPREMTLDGPVFGTAINADKKPMGTF